MLSQPIQQKIVTKGQSETCRSENCHLTFDSVLNRTSSCTSCKLFFLTHLSKIDAYVFAEQ